MEMDEYQKAALRTENKDHQAVRERLTSDKLHKLYIHLSDLMMTAKALDALKKSIFYGKDVEIPNPTSFNHPFPNDNMIQSAEYEFKVDAAIRMLHAVLGTATETGELVELMLKSSYFGNPTLSPEDWKKEWGDVKWYTALGCDVCADSESEVAQLNIDKLRRRYPEKFEEGLAQNHDSR